MEPENLDHSHLYQILATTISGTSHIFASLNQHHLRDCRQTNLQIDGTNLVIYFRQNCLKDWLQTVRSQNDN